MSTLVLWQGRENIWMVGVFSHATLLPMNHSHDNYNKSDGDQHYLLRTIPPTLPFSMQTFGCSYQHDVLSDSQLYAFSHAPFLSHLPFPRAWKMLWKNVRYFLEGRRQNKTKQKHSAFTFVDNRHCTFCCSQDLQAQKGGISKHMIPCILYPVWGTKAWNGSQLTRVFRWPGSKY